MSKLADGGPAFPVPGRFNGMSLRDYFAGQALAGLLSHQGPDGVEGEHRAMQAYEIADAMLIERDEAQP